MRRREITDLSRWIIQENLEILDPEVRYSDIANLPGPDQLLHLLPRLDEVPVWEVLLQVIGVRR